MAMNTDRVSLTRGGCWLALILCVNGSHTAGQEILKVVRLPLQPFFLVTRRSGVRGRQRTVVAHSCACGREGVKGQHGQSAAR